MQHTEVQLFVLFLGKNPFFRLKKGFPSYLNLQKNGSSFENLKIEKTIVFFNLA